MKQSEIEKTQDLSAAKCLPVTSLYLFSQWCRVEGSLASRATSVIVKIEGFLGLQSYQYRGPQQNDAPRSLVFELEQPFGNTSSMI
jgi:hypothetical protein